MIKTLGRRHSSSCLEASRCCWHFGQYLQSKTTESIQSIVPLSLLHTASVLRPRHVSLANKFDVSERLARQDGATLFQMKKNKGAYHASSGASTSGLVKRLRHCSRVKCPALAVSLRELGSSSYSSSLELTRTYSFRRSLFFHTSSRVTSSGSSASTSSVGGGGGGWG